jgi:hypothetical protein
MIFRNLISAALVDMDTAAVKNTSGRQIDGRGHFALEFDVSTFFASEPWNR